MAESMIYKGLENVTVGTTELSTVDGIAGKLIYRGYSIHDLAEKSTFEETAYLLWHGELPGRAQLDEMNRLLIALRALPEEVLGMMRGLPRTADPLDALRTVVSLLGLYDPDAGDNSREANLRKAYRLTARMATAVAAIDRLRKGREPVAPKPDLSHAANFLSMLHGKDPEGLHARAFDTVLILHVDHEFNASTFSARVTASTLSDIYSAITSAIGTLKGPLHGGANTAVMAMLEEIGDPAGAEAWVRKALAEKRRIMGFGHRVYKTLDPRAIHLRRLAQELGERAGETQWYRMSEVIERVVTEEKKLYPNVDFFSASLQHLLGIPHDLFTPVFAVGRIVGWTAQVLEQYADNRLIRPRAEYVGTRDRIYVPVGERR